MTIGLAGRDVDVRGNPFEVQQTPTVSTGTPYTVGDAVGGLLTFANCGRTAGKGCTITGIHFSNKSVIIPRMSIHFFRETFTAEPDNDTWNLSDVDVRKHMHWQHVLEADWTIFGTTSSAAFIGVYFPSVLVGTSVFAQIRYEHDSGLDFVATDDLEITISGFQD